MCGTCMPNSHGNQKKASDPLEPELQPAVSSHVGSEKQNCVLHKSSKGSELLSSRAHSLPLRNILSLVFPAGVG